VTKPRTPTGNGACLRFEDPSTKAPRHVEPWDHHTGPTDVAGRLPDPLRLCEFCYKIVVRSGEQLTEGPRLPTEAEIIRHHDEGKDVRWHDQKGAA